MDKIPAWVHNQLQSRAVLSDAHLSAEVPIAGIVTTWYVVFFLCVHCHKSLTVFDNATIYQGMKITTMTMQRDGGSDNINDASIYKWQFDVRKYATTMTMRRDRGGDSLDDATICQQKDVTKATMQRDSIIQMSFNFSNIEKHKITHNHPELSMSKIIYMKIQYT